MNIFFLLKSYLKKEKYYINFEELKLQLLSHPSYPSLHSVTGVLDHFDIDNMALEVPNDKETLFQLPNNFIAQIEVNDSKEFVLVSRSENYVKIVYGDKRKDKVIIIEFLKFWSGIIVVIENENIDDDRQKTSSKKPSKIIYIITGLLILSLFIIPRPSLFKLIHFTLSLMGVVISVLVVNHELGYHSKTIDKFCADNETTSCNAVLNSKGALVFGLFKLSDMSFVYFLGLTLTWLISINFSVNSMAIILLTILAMPITLYSIYYQFKIVKKWCPLCLGIVSVLWLQCCSLLFKNNLLKSIEFDFKSYSILFFSFTIISALWLFIKPLIRNQRELEKVKIGYYKFKRDFNIFYALYNSNKLIDTIIEAKNEIVLGNRNTLLHILIVTNPSCFYCKAVHTEIEKILKEANDIKVTIRFNVHPSKDNISNKVASRLFEIYSNEPQNMFLDALHEAYKKDVDLKRWLVNWGETKNNVSENTLKMTKEWCVANSINFTPALFINGKEYPSTYDKTDLSLFIDDLIEQVKSNVNEQKQIA